MRYPILLLIGVTFMFIMWSLSDLVFGGSGWRIFVRRLLLAVIWPLAILTASGRRVLFNYGESK